MIKSDQAKGYLFSFIATVALANVYIFSKAALNELNLFQFGFFWFGLAIVWNVLYGISAGKIKVARNLKTKEYRILAIIGILEVIGTILFFTSIKKTTDPAVMSFLQNLVPLFVLMMGVTMLKESFSLLQVTGMIITLAGAIVTSFTGNLAQSGFFVPGTGYMIAATFFIALTTIISRRYISRLDPGLLSLNRAVYLFVFAAIFLIFRGESIIISKKALFNVIIGSMAGPFLTALTSYTALKYIEASKSTIIQSARGLLVIIGAWIYFNSVPASFQVAGGIITIVGVVVLISAKDIRKKE